VPCFKKKKLKISKNKKSHSQFPGLVPQSDGKLNLDLPAIIMSRLSRQCGILNISQPYRPSRPVTGTALLYGDGVCFLWGTN
jgi:hypothetical protein